jgi:outer membrane protein OmpA-like peptidoglycan-associated protein
LTGLRTEDGAAIALDELPQQTEMSDGLGRVKLPLVIGERYLFNFSKAGYEPKFILKTILVNDNRVAALLVPEKFTNAHPNSTVMQQTYINPTKTAEQPYVFRENSLTTQPIETQRITYSGDPNFTQHNDSQAISYAQNSQTIDTNITLADNFSELKTDMSRALVQGQAFELKNIYYGFGDAEVNETTKNELSPLVALMLQDPEMVIEIAAYTDSRGKAPFNLNLSQLRADNIKSHLVEKDIAPNRIKTIGYGETRLKNKCADNIDCTEEEHQINRRTEIRLLKGGKLLQSSPDAGIDIQKVDSNEGDILADANPNSGRFVNKSARQNRFLVIVGTYAKPANAEKQRQKVVSAGFVETDLVLFQDNGFYGVCVRHFDNVSEAQALSNYINSQKEFEAFVKEVK